jgi:hypothetical protein
MVMKAKSAFLAHSPFACRGCTSRFRFSKVPLILLESRPSASINFSMKKFLKTSLCSNNLLEKEKHTEAESSVCFIYEALNRF